jgi:hypothetical protein
MKELKSYREYAAFCPQLARTMGKKDSNVLMDMAAAWDAPRGASRATGSQDQGWGIR